MNSACRTKTSVEDSTRDLAASYRESGQWQQAVKLYLNAADISSRRTSGRGFEHVQPLDSIASEIAAKISAHW